MRGVGDGRGDELGLSGGVETVPTVPSLDREPEVVEGRAPAAEAARGGRHHAAAEGLRLFHAALARGFFRGVGERRRGLQQKEVVRFHHDLPVLRRVVLCDKNKLLSRRTSLSLSFTHARDRPRARAPLARAENWGQRPTTGIDLRTFRSEF